MNDTEHTILTSRFWRYRRYLNEQYRIWYSPFPLDQTFGYIMKHIYNPLHVPGAPPHPSCQRSAYKTNVILNVTFTLFLFVSICGQYIERYTHYRHCPYQLSIIVSIRIYTTSDCYYHLRCRLQKYQYTESVRNRGYPITWFAMRMHMKLSRVNRLTCCLPIVVIHIVWPDIDIYFIQWGTYP